MPISDRPAKYPESGAAYRAARDRAGMKQDELADSSGISLRSVKRIERGDSRPFRHVRDRIAEALDADPSTLPAANDAPFRSDA